MRRILLILTMTLTLAATAQEQTRRQVLIETTMGNILIELYDETPAHRDNFIRLTEAGFYDGLLFHRVIYGFMIQTGDPSTRPDGDKTPEVELHKLPAEFRYPQLFHKRGVLAAAREGDSVNPERMSSASQFYIVYGKRFDDPMLDRMQESLDRNTNGEIKLTPEVREAYKTFGGTPHLDGQYTVFGEVVEGLDIVKAIDWVDTDPSDRPLTDVRILHATVVK